MSRKVYGTDTFTVGANINLSAYDSNWVDRSASFPLSVRAATDDIRAPDAADAYIAIWNGEVLVDQKIEADIFTGPTINFPGIAVRHEAPTSRDGYVSQWTTVNNNIKLYRVVADVYTEVATGGAVNANTTYPGAYHQALGAGATVNIEAGDGINGPAAITFADTNANRHVSGQPGLDIFDDTGLQNSIDNISIYDETPLVLPTARTRRPRPIDQQNLYADGDEGRFDELDVRNWFRTRSGLLVPA